MVTNNTTDTPQICDLCAHCGTRTGSASAPSHCTHDRPHCRVPGVPQRAQTWGIPNLFARFASGTPASDPAYEPEPVSATGGGEQNVAFDGGGEEPAASDDGDCWIIDADASAMLNNLEEVDFDDVPVCSCGHYYDVQTLENAWHCSHCDPAAEERRKRTSRLLSQAERIRRENSLTE